MRELISELKMAAYMCEHGCCLLLVADELKEAYRGVLIHWRDLNGCWYAARWRDQDHQFEVSAVGAVLAEGEAGMPIAGPESHAGGL